MLYSLLRHDTMQFGTNVWRNLFCKNPVNSRSPHVTIWTTHPRLQAHLLLLVLYLCILWEKYILRNWPSDWNLYRLCGTDCRTYRFAPHLIGTLQHVRLKYNFIHFISTMSYVQILILNVNKDLNQTYNMHWKIILYNCDFHYVRCFSKRLLKTGSACTTKYEVPEREYQNVFLTMRTGTLTQTPFLYIYIYIYKIPKVKHNPQSNSHTYCNKSETFLYFDFFVWCIS